MIRGYGNTSDPKAPREDNTIDRPHPKRSITQKILSSLPPAPRDTPANRRMAKQNGWTDEEFQQWVDGKTDEEGLRDG